MDPLDFNKIASHLVSKGGAAAFRTAISRAYYGTYLFLFNNMNDLGIILPRNMTSHVKVKSYLNNCGDSKLLVVASQLGDMHSKRIKADYNLNNKDVESKKTAIGIVKQANKMNNTIKERFETNSEEIIDKINEYRSKVE